MINTSVKGAYGNEESSFLWTYKDKNYNKVEEFTYLYDQNEY